MARWTASAKWAEGPALDGQRDMPLALRLSEGLGSTARGDTTEVLMDDAELSILMLENASPPALDSELASTLGAFPVVRVGCGS